MTARRPTAPVTARELVAELQRLARSQQNQVDEPDVLGVRMRDLFDAAKAASAMALDQIDSLFDQPSYEARLAACCILDFSARRKLANNERRELYDLYLRRHDRITHWGMVDRAAPRVIGGFLAGQPLDPLALLAKADQPMRRRTAITAPLYFVRYGTDADIDASFAIAEALAADPIPEVHNAVGIFLKHASRRRPDPHRAFLDAHARSMPRPALRLAIKALGDADRRHYLAHRS